MLVRHHGKPVTSSRNLFQSSDFNGGGRSGLAQAFTTEVRHRPDAPAGLVNADPVANAQRAILHQNCCHRTAATVNPRLDDGTGPRSLRVSRRLGNVGDQQDHLQQVVKSELLECRNFDSLNLTTPTGDKHTVICQLLLHTLGTRVGTINLVDRDDERHLGCPGMLD